MQTPKLQALCNKLDSLIETHGKDNPELLKDLQELRNDLRPSPTKNLFDFAITAIRVAQAIEWIKDHLPPP